MSAYLHVGISGGKDSTALLLWALHESDWPRERVVATFCDTGNEAPVTIDYVRFLSDNVHPIETIHPPRDFYALVRWKKRFPSPTRRFCTSELKIKPLQSWLKAWKERHPGDEIVLASGVRADESPARAKLPKAERDQGTGDLLIRPLLTWTLQDVWTYLAKYKVPPNPLYGLGAKRVGCFPCIMSSKEEIRRLAENFPERVEQLAKFEREAGVGVSFFGAGKVPPSCCSLVWRRKDGREVKYPAFSDVVDWSHTTRGGMQYALPLDDDLIRDDGTQCPSSLGACE